MSIQAPATQAPPSLSDAQESLLGDRIDILRVGYSDLIGTERGRDLVVGRLARTAGNGVAFCRSVYGTTPMGDVVDIEGGMAAGLPDVLAVLDQSTMQKVPNGEAPGNVYVAGLKGDPQNVLLDTLRKLAEYGIEVVAANHEFSSGQFEIDLWHSIALDAADRAFRFKTAIKELARAKEKLATFMAKPFNDEGGSGFHLHFSALDEHGTPLFDDPSRPLGLSATAEHAVAGILAHPPALAALLNPTINSYKRFGPDTLAPWLIDWGLDNRSAMVRIPPERGKAARLELRLGDASANPYLAIAALLAGALLGIRHGLAVPEPLEGYGYDPAKSAKLPDNLSAALDALEADEELTELLGPLFVRTFVTYKRNELERFGRWITDWEFREYTYHL